MGIGTALFAIAVLYFCLISEGFRVFCLLALAAVAIGFHSLISDANKPVQPTVMRAPPPGFEIEQNSVSARYAGAIEALREGYATRRQP